MRISRRGGKGAELLMYHCSIRRGLVLKMNSVG